MQCYNPVFIRSPSGGIRVPCGQCFACQANRRKEWAFRLKEEMKHSVCSYTVTLTYDDQHLPPLESFSDDPLLAYLQQNEVCDLNSFYYHPINSPDVQKFFKRLRKSGIKFRYFGVGEYGSHSNRPHYHIIFFFKSAVKKFDFDRLVRKKWELGTQIVVDETDDSCIEYTLKYCLKPKWIRQPEPKIYASKQPFIGYDFFSYDMLLHLMHNRNSDMIKFPDHYQRLPKIYRRIYTDNDKKDNTKSLSILSLENQIYEEREAASRGITYQEYRQRKIEAHKTKCIKQIKAKTL